MNAGRRGAPSASGARLPPILQCDPVYSAPVRQRSSHHASAVCNDCHTPHPLVGKYLTKAENGWNHSLRFTLQDFPDPIRIRPANAAKLRANCLRCHGDMAGQMPQEDCVRCHAGVGHGPRR